LDINLSQDNKLFVYHDKTINNIPLHNLTYEEIKSKNNNIPLIEEVLHRFTGSNYVINIEIKSYPDNKQSYCDLIVKTVKKYKVKYFFSSFSDNICQIIKNKNQLCYKLSDINENNGNIVHYSEINESTKGVYTLFDKDFNENDLLKIKHIGILITDDIKKTLDYFESI
jgi:glycerophosphoryl diester phosphodiesterase